jgi:O-antigen ligase
MVLALIVAVALVRLPTLAAGAILLAILLIVLTLIRPLIGLGAALVIGSLGAYENVIFGNLPIESGQLLFLFVVAAWFGSNVLNRRIVFHRTAVNLPLIIFIVVTALSLLGSISLATGIKESVKWIELGLAMIMVVDLSLPSPKQDGDSRAYGRFDFGNRNIRYVMAILLIAGVSQAVLGIWQFGLRGEGPEHFIVLERFYRAFGTFMQPNPFGGFMGVTAALAIGTLTGLVMNLVIARRNQERPSFTEWLWLGFVIGSAILTSLALLMSWSRGAWLGFAAAMAMLVLFLPMRRRVGLLLLLSAVILLLIFVQLDIIPQSLLSRIGTLTTDLQLGDVRGEQVTIENYALVERLAHWQTGLDMARENLWSGVGFGNYGRAYGDFALLNWPFPLGHAHNYYINIVAEAGVAGLLVYLIFWGAVFVQVIRILGSSDWPRRGMALGLLAAWTAITVHHLVDKLYVNNMFIFFGVMLGLQQILDINSD